MRSEPFDWPAWVGAMATAAAFAAAVVAAIFAGLAYRSQKAINDRAVRQVEERFAALVAWWFVGRPVADEDSIERRLVNIPEDDGWYTMESITVQNGAPVPIRNVKYATLPADVAEPTWWRVPDVPPGTVAVFDIKHIGQVITT